MFLVGLNPIDVLAGPGYGGHMDGGWWWGMALPWWILTIAILGVVAWMLRSNTGRGEERRGDSQREILDRLYAQGEIDRDEFLERRADLVEGADR